MMQTTNIADSVSQQLKFKYRLQSSSNSSSSSSTVLSGSCQQP
jgi:hypothetical protein